MDKIAKLTEDIDELNRQILTLAYRRDAAIAHRYQLMCQAERDSRVQTA